METFVFRISFCQVKKFLDISIWGIVGIADKWQDIALCYRSLYRKYNVVKTDLNIIIVSVFLLTLLKYIFNYNGIVSFFYLLYYKKILLLFICNCRFLMLYFKMLSL